MSLYVTVNVLCSLVIVILMVMVRRGVMHESDQKVFFNLCFHSLLLFLLDILWTFFDGKIFFGSRTFNILVNAAYFSQIGILCYYWSGYSLFLIGKEIKSRMVSFLFALPMLIIVLLGVASIWTGWFFYIDTSNCYHRGPLLFIQVILDFIYLLLSFFVAFFMVGKYRNRTRRDKLVSVSALGFMPFVAEIAQMQAEGTSIFCVGAALGLLIVFLELQKEMISVDPLTKLNNRNQASIYLENRFRQTIPNKFIYMFVLDLDLFKQINDNFGHLAGDRALLAFASVLKRVCGRRGHFISRFGGDEFIVVANLENDECASELANIVSMEVEKESSEFPFELKTSIGFAKFEEGDSEQTLFERADRCLYRAKQKNHKKIVRGEKL